MKHFREKQREDRRIAAEDRCVGRGAGDREYGRLRRGTARVRVSLPVVVVCACELLPVPSEAELWAAGESASGIGYRGERLDTRGVHPTMRQWMEQSHRYGQRVRIEEYR